MPQCKRIQSQNRKVCIGDLRNKITLQVRTIAPPSNVDFTEVFTSPVDVFAMVKTLIGTVVFDGVETDQAATHDFFIRYRADVTAETWILWDDVRYDILRVEDLDGRRTFLRLRSAESGDAGKNMSAI